MSKIILYTCFVGVLLMQACEPQESIPIYKNPNLTDSTGLNTVRDLFISGELDAVPFEYFNGVNGYSNWTISNIESPCGVFMDRLVQVHTTAFIIPEYKNSGFYIDFRGCVANDSMFFINRVDSVFEVGPYEYYPSEMNDRSVVIRYIDSDSSLWSTSFGSNSASFSEFTLSALVDNASDNNSKKVAFGRFEGYLYNSAGDDSLRLKIGQFKGRIVQ